jgi:hypothetical protein
MFLYFAFVVLADRGANPIWLTMVELLAASEVPMPFARINRREGKGYFAGDQEKIRDVGYCALWLCDFTGG